MNDNKSLIKAYILSIIGGVFGLHHLYLGRTQHAILWFTTFGGFGLGFIYEFLFLLKRYVQEENHDLTIVNEYKLKISQRKSPAFEVLRFIGQYFVAVYYGFIAYHAFPETFYKNPSTSLLVGCLTCFAIACGTKMVGTVGPRQCSLIWPLLGALFGLPLIIWQNDGSPSFNVAGFASSFIFEWKVEWNLTYFSDVSMKRPNESQSSLSSKRTRQRRQHFVKRCLIFGLGVIVFSAVFTSAVYQHLQVDIKGKRVKIKDVLADFFKSQEFMLLYQQLSNIAHELWRFYLHYGLKGMWTQIWMAFDSENERQAYDTLDLSDGASQSEIESQCRTLSRKWHPDRYRETEQKRKAEHMFMNIQQACDRLSRERRRRQLINRQRRENPY